MRRLASVLVALLLVGAASAGCGDGDEGVSRSPDPGDDGAERDPQVVRIVSATAGGGTVDEQLVVPRVSPRELRRFTGQFSDRFAGEIERAVRTTRPPYGTALVVEVVSIGCDVPSDVRVEHADEELRVALEPVWTGVSRLPECFAPVTSVALVLVDSDWVFGRL